MNDLQLKEEKLQELVLLEQEAKSIKEKQAEVKKQLLEIMELNDVKKFENDFLTITYVDATTRTSLDSGKIKKDLPDLYELYKKTSMVKPSVRIKLK